MLHHNSTSDLRLSLSLFVLHFSYTLFFKEVFSGKFIRMSIIRLVYQAVDFSRLLVAIDMDCPEMFRQV